MQFHYGDQGGFHCGASTQASSILNYFISKFFKVPKISLKLPKFPLKFSNSSQPGWQAGTIKATPWKNLSQIPNPTSPQRDVCTTIRQKYLPEKRDLTSIRTEYCLALWLL